MKKKELQLPKLRIPETLYEKSCWPDETEREGDPLKAVEVEAPINEVSLQREPERRGASPWALLRRAVEFLLQWKRRQQASHIPASEYVLRTYSAPYLYGHLSLSGRLRSFIRHRGSIRYVWNVLEINLAVLSGILYVYSTYYEDTPLYMKNIQDFISLVFLCDYMLHIFCERSTLHYVFSARGVVEFLSFIPLAFLFKPGKGSKFIHLLQLLRIVRIFSCLGEIGIVGSTATQQIILLVVATVGVVFLDAGILQWLENGFSTDKTHVSSSLTYWQSFYFLIVTVATVGYGDVVPTTTAGQVLAVLTIIGAVVILPSQIGKITSVASRRPYGQSFSSWKLVDSRFVIISGSVKLPIVQEFLSELFHAAHYEDLEIYPLYVVIMGPFRPS